MTFAQTLLSLAIAFYSKKSTSVFLQDIQAEIDSHNDIFKSVEGNKSKMVKALGSSEEAVFLQHRLDDMNQRWSDLKAKSANIRLVIFW